MNTKYKLMLFSALFFIAFALFFNMVSAYPYYSDYNHPMYTDFSEDFPYRDYCRFGDCSYKPRYDGLSYSFKNKVYSDRFYAQKDLIVKPRLTKFYRVDYYDVYRPRIVYDYLYTKKQVTPIKTIYTPQYYYSY